MADNNKNAKFLKSKAIRTTAITLLCVVLGIIVAFEYKAVVAEKNKTGQNSEDIETYQAEIIELTNKVATLQEEKEQLEEKVTDYESGTGSEKIKSLEEENEKYKELACLTEVTGEGVVIRLNFSEDSSISLSQTYINTLINELRCAEATAISINGERVTSFTEIRALSSYIVVNGKAFYSPVEITAIGDRKKLDSGLNMCGIIKSFENFFTVHGGSMEYSMETGLTVPAMDEEKIKELAGAK